MHTRLCQPKTPCHIYSANGSREKTLHVCGNVEMHMHIVEPSWKYNRPYAYTFFPHPCSLCLTRKHTATRTSAHTHRYTRACHLRRHTDTNPIIRARRWQTTQPWVVVKTKAIHILRNERSVWLTLFLPLSPISPLSFLLQIICTRKPSIFLQLCDS